MNRRFFLGMALLLMGCGSSTLPEPAITPDFRVGNYLLVADSSAKIDVFRVELRDGSLEAVEGSPFDSAADTHALTLHPSGRFVYAGLNDVAQIDGFQLNGETGELSQLPGFPLDTVPDNLVRIDRSGQFLYVVGDPEIDGFRVGANGSLTRLAGFPLTVPGLVDPTAAVFSPNDQFLYVTDRGSNQLFGLRLNASSGALSLASQRAVPGNAPTAVEIEPGGRFLYVAERDGTLPGFALQADGSLSPLPGPAAVYAGTPTLTFDFDFKDDILFVGDGTSRSLNAFRVSANGALTGISGYPRALRGGPATVSYPGSPYVYTSDRATNVITGLIVDLAGNLNLVPGSPALGSGGPAQLVPARVSF